ncbi:tRNA dihydrouridine synthase DusB [uncultured Endozoicomonas sp.]|uniref:tRNA dihydrouridine synthase DusB n=1 Tax=uncultured Endozoicomonas sp. TaxID=432652 RepID=UPI0026073E65|nr:tRNA dihydrouridine synthase DusB [uncultured Endozoicomonas sp.]
MMEDSFSIHQAEAALTQTSPLSGTVLSKQLVIGSYSIENPVILAPMAGVTDSPFRKLCLKMGAGMAVSEMVTSNPKLWNTRKSRLRMDHSCESEPRSVQIVGGDPQQLAEAARLNQEFGAQIVDLNMGCPAKKVSNKAAGSALLKDIELVESILKAVTAAVDIPVTLKIRTGWDPDHRNGVDVAKLAEQYGIAALAVHGRTRACMYKGDAEYETIARIVEAVNIPVIANGDITSPEKAKYVLDYTGASALMIGRAAQGQPWIFREINHFLKHGERLLAPEQSEIQAILLDHLSALHAFYGELQGVRIARKHVGWYMQNQPSGLEFRRDFNKLESSQDQHTCIQAYFERFSTLQRKAQRKGNGEVIAA